MFPHVEITHRKGKVLATLPKPELDQLIEAYEMVMDIKSYDRFQSEKQRFFPLELVKRKLKKENPIRLYREYRSMSQKELAEKTKITAAYLSELEHGKKEPSIKVLKALAKALDVNLEQLLRL